MTTKDEALKQALDALKLGAAMYSPAGTAHAQIAAAIIACREALAQKDEQEPNEVVYAYRRKGIDDFCTCDERRYKELSEKPNLFETAVFYTAPPKRQPLTDEKLRAMWVNYAPIVGGVLEFARAIEAAHGIGAEHDKR